MKVLSKDRRKYLIIEALRGLDVEVDCHTQQALPIELGITDKTFRSWLNIEKGSDKDIPAGKLIYIAKRVGKTVEELCNDIPKVRTYTKELKDPSNIMAKFNLS